MKRRYAVGTCILALATAVGAWAQGSATANLRGTIKDPNGGVIANATVTVRDDARNVDDPAVHLVHKDGMSHRRARLVDR